MSDDLIKRDYDLVFPSGYVGTPEQLRNALTEMWRREKGKEKSLLIHAAIFSLAETQAKLAKAVEALRDATQMLSQCTFTNIRIRGQYFERQEMVDKANAVLAELEGGE
jgi:hypothetical protein